MSQVIDCIDFSVCASGSGDRDLFVQESRQGVLETFLDGLYTILNLPAAERRPVVGEDDLVAHDGLI